MSRQDEDPDSTLNLYRTALSARRSLLATAAESVEWLPTAGREDVVAYRRGDAIVVCVFGDEAYVVPDDFGAPVLSSGPLDGRTLPGSSAAWFRATS